MQFNGIIEETKFEIDREFTVRPLERKGLNKHFVNLVSADVFRPKKQTFLGFIKDIFMYCK